MFGNLSLKARPIKLGFLVDPYKKRSIMQAIEISSTLWGGAYNPIIPVYKRAPRNWEKPFKAPKAETVVKGYIEAFDPDVLIQCIPQVPKYISDLGLEIVHPTEIWEPLSYDRNELGAKYGIGLFELYDLIYQEHFRYLEKHPPKIVIPQIPKNHSLFWSSLFGSLPNLIKEKVDEYYKNPLDIEAPRIDPSRLEDLMKSGSFFPRRITQYGLNFLKRSGFMDGDCVFFMDMTKNLDVIDYWNLRALGRQVIPVPIQLKGQESLKKIVIKFLKTTRRSLRGNSKIYNHADFICSRNSEMDKMKEYATSLDIKKDSSDTSNEPFFALQHWYPRIWDEWAREKDWAEAGDIYYEESEIDLGDIKTGMRTKFILPEFISKYTVYGEPRVANEVNIRLYGADEVFAQLFPKSSGKKFLRTIGGLSYRREWRVGRNGLVKLIRYDHSERWNVPLAKDVFFAWLEDLGWSAKLSAPGLTATQIFKQLEGSVGVFDSEEFIKLLEDMNGKSDEGYSLSVAETKNRFKQFDTNGNLYKFLISKRVFRVGVKIQCPKCQRKSWFTLESLKEKLMCPKCSDEFSSLDVVDQSVWSYKTSGPFSIQGYADGAYCVLQAIEFLDHNMHSLRITPVYSFEAKNKSDNTLEADFGALWQDTVFGELSDGVIFGECKTFGEFKEKDFKRMKRIVKNFPGAVIAFCTYRKKLTKNEIKEIKKIAKVGRKRWKGERPINPVIIITGNELTNMFGPPYCWEKMGFGTKFEHIYGLLEVSDATQQIYLNLPSWKEEWFKEFEKKRKRLIKRK